MIDRHIKHLLWFVVFCVWSIMGSREIMTWHVLLQREVCEEVVQSWIENGQVMAHE